MSRFTDSLIAVSEEVKDELVSLGVADESRFIVVPLGFDLRPFQLQGAARASVRAAVREELGLSPHDKVVTLVARLVPIKRVDRFLRIANELSELEDVKFVVVGDGELRDELRRSRDARALSGRLIWTGFRHDMPAVCFGSDVVVLTSQNEGTPVSLIEAQAAGVPVVSTDVGGARSVVASGITGYVVAPDQTHDFAGAIREILRNDGQAAAMAAEAQERAVATFGLERLVHDIVQLYDELRSALMPTASDTTRQREAPGP